MAKARVAPLKITSVPRLELQAAVMGVRLACCTEEGHDVKPDQRVFWTDSRTVLTWIKTGARAYKPFVAHRLAEIEEETKQRNGAGCLQHITWPMTLANRRPTSIKRRVVPRPRVLATSRERVAKRTRAIARSPPTGGAHIPPATRADDIIKHYQISHDFVLAEITPSHSQVCNL
ncbi:hypothetical protein EVAR_65513_1 [Eumeta japonica]|uniref:Uncharacterized protein n=1 Tax=Eumeta variegata TaxID=151549 RepID=A0A4C1ZGW4_EUMVA|nr:hypothetical protein EVAR_65513_1 [Eumeta japonica]